MTSVRIPQKYEDNLWYPILVLAGGGHRIVEMQGKSINAWNDAADGKSPPKQWVPLTDADRQRAFESLPDMLDGFLHKWGWLHFAKAIEQICKEKNCD